MTKSALKSKLKWKCGKCRRRGEKKELMQWYMTLPCFCLCLIGGDKPHFHYQAQTSYDIIMFSDFPFSLKIISMPKPTKKILRKVIFHIVCFLLSFRPYTETDTLTSQWMNCVSENYANRRTNGQQHQQIRRRNKIDDLREEFSAKRKHRDKQTKSRLHLILLGIFLLHFFLLLLRWWWKTCENKITRNKLTRYI